MRRRIGMRIFGLYALMASMLLLALFSATPAHAAMSWNVQRVDDRAAGLGNGYCPIVVDSNNIPNIAYTGLNSSNRFVRYAKWNSSIGGFSIQEIARSEATDMALDANNNPHILYEVIRGGLWYASWTGLDWTTQTVDTIWVTYAALALDSQGNPHAACSTGQTLWYASRSGSTWTTETVDNGTEIPIHLSLALDANDKPYILYSNPDLKIATLENSGWKIETVALPDSVNGVGNMILDSKGHPHLIYSTGVFYDVKIKYVSWTGGSWKTETMVSGIPLDLADIRYPGFLALDSLDYPHICFVGGFRTGYKLMYAGWTGLEWSIQPVVQSGINPVYMALDSNRTPHISVRSGSIGFAPIHLIYATASEPVPLASPLLIALPMLSLVVVAVIAAAVIVYLWRKK
jgi:hypothetical protein